MAVEIERKFLVAEPPADDVLGAGVHYRQGYLAGEGDVESRVRIGPDAAWITVKAGRGVARTEVEVAIPVPRPRRSGRTPPGAGSRRCGSACRSTAASPRSTATPDELDGLWTVEVEFDSRGGVGGVRTAAVVRCRAHRRSTGGATAALARHGRPAIAEPPLRAAEKSP